jgi:hypothetical protein
MSFIDGTIRGELPEKDAVSVLTDTPWGRTRVALTPHLFNIVTNVDGRTTGSKLLERLDGRVSGSELIRALLILRRLRVVSFSAGVE